MSSAVKHKSDTAKGVLRKIEHAQNEPCLHPIGKINS